MVTRLKPMTGMFALKASKDYEKSSYEPFALPNGRIAHKPINRYRWDCDGCGKGRTGYHTQASANKAALRHVDKVHPSSQCVQDWSGMTFDKRDNLH